MEENFSPRSKVWIYQCNRPFTPEEIKWLNTQLEIFAKQWSAHNAQLKATAHVVEDRFILLLVDETQNNASGCSIDKSVHFLKQVEEKLHVELFNRMLVSYIANDTIITIPAKEAEQLFLSGAIHDDTLIFNTLIHTKEEFDSHFKIPLRNSWIKNYVSS